MTGGFGDLDQVVKAGVGTLITGEADYPTEVKARELGINLILAGHRETEVFGVKTIGGAISQRIMRVNEGRHLRKHSVHGKLIRRFVNFLLTCC